MGGRKIAKAPLLFLQAWIRRSAGLTSFIQALPALPNHSFTFWFIPPRRVLRFSAVSYEIPSFPVPCARTRGATLGGTFSPSRRPARQPRDSGGPVNLAVRHCPSRPSYLLCIKVISPWVLYFPGDSCCRRVEFEGKGVPTAPLNGKPE